MNILLNYMKLIICSHLHIHEASAKWYGQHTGYSNFNSRGNVAKIEENVSFHSIGAYVRTSTLICKLHLVSGGCWLQWSKSKYEDASVFSLYINSTWSFLCLLQLLTLISSFWKNGDKLNRLFWCHFWRNNHCSCRINFAALWNSVFKVQKGRSSVVYSILSKVYWGG